MSVRSLCVYCGSSPGYNPDYVEAARQLAGALVQRDITLVYGGGRVGIMGAIADAALAAGGRVVGVIPQALLEKEVGHHDLTELHVVDSMHERKALMARLSDGFIALPGGIGTLEELFEIWTWGQLGLHARPCGLLNAAGYFDQLISFLDHATAAGFIRPFHRDMLLVAQDAGALLARMEVYVPPPVARWIRQTET